MFQSNLALIYSSFILTVCYVGFCKFKFCINGIFKFLADSVLIPIEASNFFYLFVCNRK